MNFTSIKGTKDILPEEVRRWQDAEEAIRTTMHRFNYREIRTPVFEETALFARGIGETTDIVGKEMYTFQDRSGTSLTLKPEMTASVIRAYIQHNLGEQQPLVKVYYIAPMFRQERPQAGRLRQFHQFGAEAIGSANPAVDAENIALAAEVYRGLGVTRYDVKINSVGCPACRPAYREKLRAYLATVLDRLSEESRRRFETNPLRILDSKDEKDRRLTEHAPLMKDHLCKECSDHFSELQTILRSVEVPFSIDGRIVRGLDYYTKTAYEITTTALGSQDALAGGGRYDLLVKELGGKQTPAVGFAAGIERLLMAMAKADAPVGPPLGPTIFLAAADQEGQRWALRQAMQLRRHGISCELDHLGRSLKAQMREADRQSAAYVIVVGERELNAGSLELRQMASGELRSIAVSDLLSELSRLQVKA